jgi:ribonuclease Z
VRELGLALDIGRCPKTLVSVPHVFVTHAHLDHALGIPYYAAQRALRRLPPGTVYVPAENRDDYLELMALHEKLEGQSYPLVIRGVPAGDEVRVRRSLVVKAHRATHRVVANAWELIEERLKLRPELSGASGSEIARIRSEEGDVTEPHRTSLLFYTGDTDRRILESNEALFRSEVLVIECSFVRDGDQERAQRYTHIHLDDIFEFAGRFENRLILLTHFSLRDRPAAIHELVSRRAPAVLRARIRLALPEPFSLVQ